MQSKEIIPVILGADLNSYSVARAFHEAYGVKSYAFGPYMLGTTGYSRIIHYKIVKNIDKKEVALPLLESFAKEHAGSTLILIGCTDSYADFIIENKEVLSQYYFCACPRKELANQLISKESFYKMCDTYGIDYPKTVIAHDKSDIAKLDDLPFSYPVIVKPSSSICYWKYPFPDMKKVYVAENAEEAKKITATIFDAGYDDSVIFQDFIPGDDSGMYVLTSYSDQTAKVKMMCLGHVLLEEHTPKGRGNHVAILTEYKKEFMEKIQTFLENMGYTGFSNFDIKYDPRDGKFKVFEINLRQGRSNFYITKSGANLAEYPVGDCQNTLPKETNYVKTPSFWYTVPKKIIYSYIEDEATMKTVKKLVKEKKAGTALFYAKDFLFSPIRLFYLLIHNHRYFKKYKRYP